MTGAAEGQTIEREPRPPRGGAITAMLNHPVAMAIKGPIRDLVWILRGAVLRNPPLPARVESILFVCLGNICRSPFAAVLAAERLRRDGPAGIRCASAGIRTMQDARSPRAACDVAAAYGLSLADHRPQPLTRELMNAHDLIVVMEAAHLQELRATYPDASGKVVLLSLFDEQAAAGYDRYNIADPFLRPRAAFESCYHRIERALSGLFSHLGPHERRPGA